MRNVVIVLSAILTGVFMVCGSSVAAAQYLDTRSTASDSLKWQLPKDSNKVRTTIHFKPGEVLGGSHGKLSLPDIALNQNIQGEKRISVSDSLRTGEFTIFFRHNRTDIDTNYLWNTAQLALLRHFLGGDIARDTITVYAFASPEGHYGHNVWLSKKRAETARDYILTHSELQPDLVQICYLEENWPALRQAVRNFYHGDNREALLVVLGDAGLDDEVRKKIIIDLDGGKTYKYLIDTLMPPMRSAIVCAASRVVPAIEADIPVTAQTELESPGIREPRHVAYGEEDGLRKRTIVALKTNMLYDLATVLNYQIEFPIGKQFSAVFEEYTPWWVMHNNRICIQYLTLGGEARWWFKPEPRPESEDLMLRDVLVGHYIGLYGLWGKTDLQWDKKGTYQCRGIVSAGVTYGYVFPISKHLNLELSASVGYARIPYQHYNPSEDWQILWRDRSKVGVRHWFGPTKITATLSIPIVVSRRVKKQSWRTEWQ
ncbi:MAG: DUF3575 domain-containing protein [Bacteroidales bacterium]|nr:DUF3575 domain-containing protein [Bacteroidales bacterium]